MTTATATATALTVDYWADRKRQGLVRVMFVGILGDTRIPCIVKRVTTRNVFVKFADSDKPQPIHPADLRPR